MIAVIEPLPSAPGPARSRSFGSSVKTDAGYPRATGASPLPVATSRSAWAKRVTESRTRSTRSPRSRKYSATRMAVSGARRRIIALSSLVATTATVLAIAAAPIVSSRNSRTSRPRSPTRATTTVSNASAAASMASSVDLPTPEPAKTPMRWPKQSGVKMSMTRTPVRNAVPTRWRCKAPGVAPGALAASPRSSGGPLSMARARASMLRPRQESWGSIVSGPRRSTASPMPASELRSKGATTTCSRPIRTTSPRRAPAWLRCSMMSPSRAISDRP